LHNGVAEISITCKWVYELKSLCKNVLTVLETRSGLYHSCVISTLMSLQVTENCALKSLADRNSSKWF